MIFENIDCMEGMKKYSDDYFDLAIVDPPYGIGVFTCVYRTNNNGKRVKILPKNYSDDYTWNNKIPDKEYFTELYRVSKKQIIWGANYYNCFTKGGALVWYKGKTTETVSHCEIASLSFQQKVDYVEINWQSGFYREMKEGKPIHPCQKPIKLYEWILYNYAKEGYKILDTHVGSASSLIACERMGYDYVGFELDKKYYEDACKRIKEDRIQTKLF